MKKIILFIFLMPFMVKAQTTKTEDIFIGGNCKLSCEETFDNDSLVSAYVTFDAKDDRLPTLKNYFTICYDTPQNFYKFLTELEKFFADTSSISADLKRHKVEIDKSTGSKTVKVYEQHGLIFHRFQPALITNIKARLHDWAVKNKINLEK